MVTPSILEQAQLVPPDTPLPPPPSPPLPAVLAGLPAPAPPPPAAKDEFDDPPIDNPHEPPPPTANISINTSFIAVNIPLVKNFIFQLPESSSDII